MRPLPPTIRLLILVLLAAPRAVAHVPNASVPDMGSEDGEQDPIESLEVSFVLQGIFHDDELELSSGQFGEHYGVQSGAYIKVTFGF